MQKICDKLSPLCAQGLLTVHLSAISMFFLSETNALCSKQSQEPTNKRLLHLLVSFGPLNKLIKNNPSTKDLNIHIRKLRYSDILGQKIKILLNISFQQNFENLFSGYKVLVNYI